MPAMMELETRPEDVGEILVKVQEDIQQLKEKLLAQKDAKTVDLAELENAIIKTEQGLRLKTENVLNQLNNRVSTIPFADVHKRSRNEAAITMENTFDLQSSGKMAYQMQGNYGGFQLPQRQPVQLAGLTPGQQVGTTSISDADCSANHEIKMTSGTIPMKSVQNYKAVSNPYSLQNRQVLNDNYGIQLPLIPAKKETRAPVKIITGSNVDHLAVLPKANRVDAQLAPPPITEEDARKGILSLIERGLIPPAAQLTLDPAPVRHKMAALHDPQEKEAMRLHPPPPASDTGYNIASLKLDLRTKFHGSSRSDSLSNIPVIPPTLSKSPEHWTLSGKSRASSATAPIHRTSPGIRNFEMPLHPLPPPTTPASGDIKTTNHRFAIQHGRVREQSNEFAIFKQHYCLSWGSIITMLRYMERMAINYSLPVLFINGDKLADLALEFELEFAPDIADLLTCVVNREDVESIILRPGRRYLGPDGKDLAAAKIQATWKRYRERCRYLEYRRKKWAAGVIAISWIMHIKMAKVRKQLKQTRLDQLEAFRQRTKKFAASWDRIKDSKRVIIHIPSLGHSQNIRDTIRDFGIRQNTQMARLCDVSDPNVDVIYVSPVPLTEESLQYYSKLLGLRAAVESGNVDDQADMTDRYKIIFPDAIKSFPTHRMCLSTILKYSPQTLNRIKNLITGRDAYIVVGVPHKDDLSVADTLDCPILCPEPDVAHLYSTKSGCKRIFASANVEMPPSEFDVYSLQQLHECLAQLVTENLLVRRWLFKLDDEFDGRGIAYCDVAEHLRCYSWAAKEAQRYGEKWSKKWAQEAAYIKIHAEIPEILAKFAQPVNKLFYSTWEKFLDAFLSQGGIIEACPPSESITTLTVDMLIEPTGNVNIVSVGDQIHAESPFSCWGMSVPQSSVEPEPLNEACYKIAEGCKSRGIMGYFRVDFVTFINPKTMDQHLWALDISISYSDSMAMFQLLRFVSKGTLDTRTHIFDVPTVKQERKARRKRLQGQEDERPVNPNRFAVMSTRLHHTNLSVVHYSVFFQMCRAHGIGYDIKEKQGTVFTLIDSFDREKMAMLTLGDNLQGALASFARNLSVIHQEISAPNMQGVSNFKAAIEEVEGILGTTIQNAGEEED